MAAKPKLILIALSALFSALVHAHPGGLNAEGCHNNRKTGEYHCHGSRSTPTQSKQVADPTPKHQSALTPQQPAIASPALPPGCYVGPRGGTYTITKSGRKNYGGC
jgi:hypothetical protein